MELVMTLTAEIANNLPVIANVQLVPTTNNSISPLVESVALTGSGGSINSNYSVANITSTGPLGDVTVSGSAELHHGQCRGPRQHHRAKHLWQH